MWVRAGKIKAFALSGTQRRIWRFKQSDLDAAVLEPVVHSPSLTVPKKRRVK